MKKISDTFREKIHQKKIAKEFLKKTWRKENNYQISADSIWNREQKYREKRNNIKEAYFIFWCIASNYLEISKEYILMLLLQGGRSVWKCTPGSSRSGLKRPM